MMQNNMKKVFMLSLAGLFALLSWMTFFYFNTNSDSFIYPQRVLRVQIQIAPKKLGQPLIKVEKIAQDMNLSVAKIDYDGTKHIFRVYHSDMYVFSARIKSGRLPESRNEYLGSKVSDNSAQVGVISVFSAENQILIYPLSAHVPTVTTEEFQLDTTDEEIAASFAKRVSGLSGYTASYVGGENNDSYSVNNLRQDYQALLILAVIITTLLALYLLFQKLKEETVKKTLGYSSRRLVLEFLPRVYLPVTVSMAAIVAGVTAIALFIYNRLTLWQAYFRMYLLLCLAFTAVIYSIVFAMHLVLIRHTQPVGIIKNKFPYKSVLTVTFIYKAALVLLLIPMLASAWQLYQQNRQYGISAERLEMLKDYVELPVYSPRMETTDGQYELSKQYLIFFKRQNAKGAILFDPSSDVELEADGEDLSELYAGEEDDYSTPDKKYFVSNHHVFVNYEYLRQNPVYGADGKQVLFTDEDDPDVQVLVPEKYRRYEKSITKQLQKYINTQYYIMDDVANDADSDVQHEDRPFVITWVKDGQSYFTYDPEIGMGQSCCIQDVICIVYNNTTMPLNLVAPAFSSGRIKIPLAKNKQGLSYFSEDIKECGLSDSVCAVDNSYERVSEAVYSVQKQLRRQNIFNAVYGIVFIVLLFVNALTILKAQEKKRNLFLLLGYSALRYSAAGYMRSAVFWFVLFLTAEGILHTELLFTAGICALSFLLENILQTVLQMRRGILLPRTD